MSSSPSIEIIPVDPNSDFNLQFDNDDNSDDGDSQTSSNEDIELRNLSRSTFRSRTDSSSIGDYDSHSSDESDFIGSDNENEFIVSNKPLVIEYIANNNNNNDDKICYVKNTTKFVKKNIPVKLKTDIFSENIINNYNNYDPISDIDTKYFDLAKFITEDEYLTEETILTKEVKFPTENIKTVSANEESDIEVDIETVNDGENNENVNNIKTTNLVKTKINGLSIQNNVNNFFMEDNIEKDPSWNPSLLKTNNKAKNGQKLKQRTGTRKIQSKFLETLKRNHSMTSKSPQKKQFGIGRGGKNISMCIKQEYSSSEDETEPIEDTKNVITTKNDAIEIKNESINNIISTTPLNIKEEIVCQSSNDVPLDNIITLNPVKRKLNLEEYKRRRENSTLSHTENSSHSKNLVKMSNPKTNVINSPVQNSISSNSKIPHLSMVQQTIQNHRNCKESLLKNNVKLNTTQQQHQTVLDPITEAKNKVLRMQELKKKAAQKRLIDFTVSAKVGPITKILPLEEMVNGKMKINKNAQQKLNDEYEEIIIVSVSCNTDIRIPPLIKTNQSTNDSNCNLSKSTELLYNISDTIQKATATDSIKISNNSLISSIQKVVFKKTVVAANENELLNKIENINKSNQQQNIENKSKIDVEQEQHGEDKIIMHLPKNRTRKATHSISTQTEILPEFPPLELILINKKYTNYDKLKSRKYRSRNKSYSSDDDYDYRSRSKSPLSTNHHHHYSSNSCNNDLSIYKHGSTSTATSSSESERGRRRNRDRNQRIYSTSPNRSDRSCSSSLSSFSNKSRRSRSRSGRRKSRSRSRSRSRYSYRKRSESRRNERQSSPAVEERRIVYVGRIEAETSKEDLKRKFLTYGRIKQITLHYKDTGMKYGFVTFEKAEDAFKAIDNGMRDSKINMYDISFGGRRAFCRATYSDLDGAATNSFQTYSYAPVTQNRNTPVGKQDDSFEALLQKMKEKLCATKTSTPTTSINSRVKT